MTAAEVESVIRVLSAAWGYFADDSAGRVALWTEHLERLDYAPTRDAARKLATTCDQLPSLAAFLRAAHEEARIARLAASSPALAPEEGLSRCSCGEMRGWALVSEDPFDVRPCERCRPEVAEQWQAGHYTGRHDRARCAECRRTGRAA